MPRAWISFLDRNCTLDRVAELGGKGASLLQLARAGFNIPASACLASEAYREFVRTNNIGEKILLELNRKEFSDMRWEEIWDASLRIRSFFLLGQIPDAVAEDIIDLVRRRFSGKLLAVRSSAPDEDTAHSSFAGLHDSFLNISGDEQLLQHVKKVWASLWSDRALLYRKELGLDVSSSSMAVVIQEMIESERSGIVFSRHPDDEKRMIVEAVYGLNQGLVDGAVEPDRWIMDRAGGGQAAHSAASTPRRAVPGRSSDPRPVSLSGKEAGLPPLDKRGLENLRLLALRLEDFFGAPQDIEWTMQADKLFVLQSRPITSISDGDQKDERSWYLSLHRSFDNLFTLWREIEQVHLPAMDAEAERLAEVRLEFLSDHELAGEIERRVAINEKWQRLYWSEFIPFAHGMRLFGEVYNEVMLPEDPFAFVSLLSGTEMLSTGRNALLSELAAMYREDAKLAEQVDRGEAKGISNSAFNERLGVLRNRFGSLFGEGLDKNDKMVLALVRQYAARAVEKAPEKERADNEAAFLAKAAELQLPYAGSELLELGRASYRLRDDDNLHLRQIEQQLQAAVAAGRSRLEKEGEDWQEAGAKAVAAALRGEGEGLTKALSDKKEKPLRRPSSVKARQLVGQPAARGIARGRCRILRRSSDLANFKEGEVLVADAIEPEMTFVAPLAAAIVERRGGMLIHGAIIAREYGIPCVTGIPDAIELLEDGQLVTVDGYLGIVTLGEAGRA